MEKQILVKLGKRSYPIFIGNNNLATLGAKLKKVGLKGRIVIITNPLLKKLYGSTVNYSLDAAGFEYSYYFISAGEKYKNIKTISNIYDYLIKNKYNRQTVVIALGGGVIGDIAGFVAATFLRGVNFIQIPTTLLAQVDSSVGGKTGVNHPKGKNLIGAFYQPSMVLADVRTLLTLPAREIRSGLAEVIKYGLIKNKSLYDLLQKKINKGLYDRNNKLLLDPETLITIVASCCQIKAEVVAADEREKNIRAILNFGHTFGHVIEAMTNYKKYTHGEAVALGMLAAIQVSIQKGYINKKEITKLNDLYKMILLPLKINKKLSFKKLKSFMLNDKKVKNNNINLILLKNIGQAVIESVQDEQIIKIGFQQICREVVK